MRFVAIGTASNCAEKLRFQLLQAAEAKLLWEFYAAGILLEAFFCDDHRRSILVLKCDSEAEAAQMLAQLPTAKAEFFEYQVSELKPFTALSEIFAGHNLPTPAWLVN